MNIHILMGVTIEKLSGYQSRQSYYLIDKIQWINTIEDFVSFLQTNAFKLEKIHTTIEQSKRLLKDCDVHGIRVINRYSDSYPKKLLSLDKFPINLYCLGNLNLLNDHKNISIVGSRSIHDASILKTKEVSRILVKNDFTIVSGLALGVDEVAHREALINNGKTIAILPSGFHHIYPRSNRDLANDIIKKGGLLVSEYAPHVRPKRHFFVHRNRIQSAISDSLTIVQAGKNSGTMHTVRYAHKLNKLIFVWSGIKERSFDGNRLIVNKYKGIEFSNFQLSLLNQLNKRSEQLTFL